MSDFVQRQEPPSEENVRRALLSFANLVQRLDEDERLVRHLPGLIRRLGDLRQMLFEFEVRVTERLLPTDDPIERESRRIVREAQDRAEDAAGDWGSE